VIGGEDGPELTVRNAGQLATLPTFFGAITGVETLPGDTPAVALTVESPFIDRLADEASPTTLAITDAALLAGDLLAAHAAPGVTVESMIAAPAPQTVRFDKPIPIFVTYVTAWANRDGSVHFRHDPHGRDARVAQLLQLD